jgi:hypothetical protein
MIELALQLRADIKSYITVTVEKYLTRFGLERVDVGPDLDSDGDPVIRVKVFFNDLGDPVDLHQTMAMTREIRAGLADRGEPHFVHFGYVHSDQKAVMPLDKAYVA